MGINVYTSHANTPYRIRYFDHKYINDDTALTDTKKVKGVFYARKHGNTRQASYITSAGIKTIKTEMQLYTNDHIENLKIDNFIYFEGKKWLVHSIEDVERVKHRGVISWQDKIITVRS